jgi:hypothetical protein
MYISFVYFFSTYFVFISFIYLFSTFVLYIFFVLFFLYICFVHCVCICMCVLCFGHFFWLICFVHISCTQQKNPNNVKMKGTLLFNLCWLCPVLSYRGLSSPVFLSVHMFFSCHMYVYIRIRHCLNASLRIAFE